MKKAGLMAVAMFSAAATFAQAKNTTRDNPKMTGLDSCIRAYNNEKALAKQAIIKGEWKTSKADYATAHADKKHIKALAAQLRSEGVRHPLILARKEIRKADNKMIVADVKAVKADKLAKQKAVSAGDSMAVQTTKNNLLVDKNELRKDIRSANRDEMKHFVLLR